MTQFSIGFFNNKRLGKPTLNDSSKLFGKILKKPRDKNTSSFKNIYFDRVVDKMLEYDIHDSTGMTLNDIMSLDYVKYEILINKMKAMKEKTNKIIEGNSELANTKKDIKKFDKKLKRMKRE